MNTQNQGATARNSTRQPATSRAKTHSARKQAPKWWRILSAKQQADIRALFSLRGSTRRSERTVTFLLDWQFAAPRSRDRRRPVSPARD